MQTGIVAPTTRPKFAQVQQLAKLAKAYPLFADLLAPELPAVKAAYEQRRHPRPGRFAKGEVVVWHAPGGYDGHDWQVRLTSEALPSFEYGSGDFQENFYRFELVTPHPLCILRVAPERELLALASYVAPAPRPAGWERFPDSPAARARAAVRLTQAPQ
ncbi:MAG TPA: hypothetical protein VF629_02985 [Hymenobacter sp.]|jgi:hypothetical protein|uniref:hypothetical protein n=1 Tax=Hymenobacter sp. TaxID=1898978 RepID=UPI002EDB2351